MYGEMAHRGLAAAVMLCMVLGGVGLWIGPGFSENGAYEGADGHSSVLSTGTAPRFLAEPQDPKYATYNVTVNITAVVQDADNDVLNVTWDWGDGSVNVTTTTSPTTPFCTIKLGHVYAPEPEQGRGWYGYPYSILFNMTIYLDDGNDNNVSCKTLVNVSMPFINGLPVRPTIHLNGTTSTLIEPADTVYVVANSSDPEGESLTWTYVFTNATDVAYRTVVVNTPATAPGENVWVNVSHSFGTIGLHEIEVFVSDALVPYQTYPHNATDTTFVNVAVNSAPFTSPVNANPYTPVIDYGEEYADVALMIELLDVDGDTVVATWDFGDGSAPAQNVTEGGTSVYLLYQVHRYTEPGLFNVTVTATDGRPGHEVVTYLLLTVLSMEVPFFAPGLPAIIDVEWGVPVDMSVTCRDCDGDSLTLTWDFGDGTDQVVQTMESAIMGVVCQQSHAWDPDPALWYGIGDTYILYYLNLSLTDGLGQWANTTTEVFLPLDHNFSPKGNMSLSADEDVIGKMVDPGDMVFIYANATDAEGEPLTWTFVYNNSDEDFLIEVYHSGLTESGATVYQNTSHVFSETGDYTVTLYLSDLADPELQTDPAFAAHNVTVGKVFITSQVNTAPVVTEVISVVDLNTGSQDIFVNETTGIADVWFGIQAIDLDGEILYATWDFGDGSDEAYNQSLGVVQVHAFSQVHQYSSTGQYNVSVVVTDGREGHEVIRYRLITVWSTNLPPELTGLFVSFSQPRTYAFVGEEVVITAVFTDQEEDPLELTWDYGDGTPIVMATAAEYDGGSTSSTVAHIFTAPGIYEGFLNYTDNELFGSGEHELQWVFIVSVVQDEEPPVACAGGNQMAEAGWVVFFDGTASSDNWGIDNYTWTLTSNGTEVHLWGPTPSFRFWTLGTYLVTLEVTDYAGNKDTATVTVEVVEEIPEFRSVATVTLVLMLALFLTAFIRRRKRM